MFLAFTFIIAIPLHPDHSLPDIFSPILSLLIGPTPINVLDPYWIV